MGKPDGPLQGLRVLDFGRYVAGPFCAALLGDFGAEVIRVERIDGAEGRGITPLAGDYGEAGAMFVQLNRNKRGMTLNPTKPRGEGGDPPPVGHGRCGGGQPFRPGVDRDGA